MNTFFARISERINVYGDAHNFTCDVCAREVFAGERICAACRGALPVIGGVFCPLCGRKVVEEGICLECKQSPLLVERARSVLLHEGEGKRLVMRFKTGKKYLCRTLAELLLPVLRSEFPDAEYLAFVPMTKKAERKRGYNQSRLLAQTLSRASGIPVCDAVRKERDTASQKALGRRERESNLSGCFRVFDRRAVAGKRLVIIDDILTTGATVNELARVLKRAGAEKAYALTVTSVQNKTPLGKAPQADE